MIIYSPRVVVAVEIFSNAVVVVVIRVFLDDAEQQTPLLFLSQTRDLQKPAKFLQTCLIEDCRLT